MSMMREFPTSIKTIGVEVEGFWSKPPNWDSELDPDCYDCDWEEHDDGVRERTHLCYNCREEEGMHRFLERHGLKEDGSVSGYAREATGSNDYVGAEYASPVLHNWSDLVRSVSNCGNRGLGYPNRVSAHTGMHVHIGVTQELFDFTMSAVYWNLIRLDLLDLAEQGKLPEQDAKWLTHRCYHGTSSNEVAGYCHPNSWRRMWERYNHVNYTAFEQHGTIEVRVCPAATTPESALIMVEQVLRSTHNYWTNPSLWEQVSSDVLQEQDLTLSNIGTVVNETVENNQFHHPVMADGLPATHGHTIVIA